MSNNNQDKNYNENNNLFTINLNLLL